MGKKKSVTIGYRYFMGLHMSICYGPVDALLSLIAGDRAAWTGNQTASGTVTVAARQLFGGDKKEGGLEGSMYVLMGEAAQGQNAYLVSKLGSDIPAYRGVCSIVYNGEVSSMSPYVKPFAFQVRRILKGWYADSVWYSAKAAIGTNMNPAHIVYECLTNPEWGMGYPASSIDTVAFQSVADTLYSEGFGISLMWNRQDTIRSFVQTIMGYINGVLRLDLNTGKFTLKLMRDDYDIDDLPVYNPNNVVSLDDYQRMSLAETVNEINVVFTDVTTGKETSLTVHDNANISAQSGIVSYTANYQAINSAALAEKVGMRDLILRSTPLAKLKLTVNREGFMLQPGDAFRFVWPKLGIDAAFRILMLNYGTVKEGAITLDAVEDVFGLPQSSYTSQQPVGWTDPTHAAAASPNRKLMELPYYELATTMSDADLAYVTSTSCYLMTLAEEPSSDALSYALWTAAGAAALTEKTENPHTPTCVTSGSLSKTATSIVCASLPDSARYAFETGRFIVIDDELMRLDGINYGTNTLTVARAVLDTVPATHASGARVWFAEEYYGYDAIEYADNDVVKVKVQTQTGLGALAIGSTPQDTITMDQRQYRPYPPGLVRFNGSELPSTITGALTVTWAHRDRLTQTASIIDQNTGSIGPEAGVTYTLTLYGQDGLVKRTETGITGTTYTWSTETADSGLVSPDGTVVLLHANGTNGSTTFTDTTGRIWTAGGHAQLSTAWSQFGTSSILFDGTGDYLSAATSFDFDFGSGDLTVELWMKHTQTRLYSTIIGRRNAPFSAGSWTLLTNNASSSAGDVAVWCANYSTSVPLLVTTGVNVNDGNAHHIAWVRSGSNHYLFVDGVLRASAIASFTITALALPCYIGIDPYATRDFLGYMDEIRIKKGVAEYTTGFTPPTSEFSYAGPPLLNTSVRAKLKAVRGGLDSWQEHDHTMTR